MNAGDTQDSHDGARYAGAVYGSLLAASVVAGSAADGTPMAAGDLVVVLISTGVVFWLAHLYVQVIGQRATLTWRRLRDAGRREWPLAQAAVPPAIAAAMASALGLSDTVATWAAMTVAVTAQVGWAVAAAVRTRYDRGVVVLSGLANLVLGLAIVVLKTLVAAH
ncbi:hypothetical protein [Nonomuraea indica]|uniref:Integral membrane protein n=1 Tax=Nonomuraea indica TaxID=1581193 RepID=A0ABW7ZXQ7_9ACTN|nr:hypothetical protein [Nonomuraea indica]